MLLLYSKAIYLDMHMHGVSKSQDFDRKCTVHRPQQNNCLSEICHHTISINLTGR